MVNNNNNKKKKKKKGIIFVENEPRCEQLPTWLVGYVWA
jgi:hypothetical protein